MPRPSRANAHHLSEIAPTATPAPLPRAGSFNGASRPLRSVPAIVSFLNPQPTLSLGGGNWSSCPIPVIAERQHAPLGRLMNGPSAVDLIRLSAAPHHAGAVRRVGSL